MKIKTKEEIFDQQALLGMVEYFPKGFKQKYSTLFRVIMNSMEAYKYQEVLLSNAVIAAKKLK